MIAGEVSWGRRKELRGPTGRPSWQAYLTGLTGRPKWPTKWFTSLAFAPGPEQPRIGMEVLGHLLAPLTHSLVRSLRSRTLLRSLVSSLAHFAHSLAHGTVNNWIAI